MSSMQRRARQAERKEQTRLELISAAADVFVDRGFHGASMAGVAASAGYTTGAIYWHFKNKDELFLAVYERYATQRVAELTALDQEHTGSLPERARSFADQWMARQADDPGFVAVALEFFVHALRDPELRRAFADRQAAVRLAVGRILEADARAAGVSLPMPAQDIATALRELGIGLELARMTDPEAIPSRLYGDFVETFYDLVLSSGAESRPHG